MSEVIFYLFLASPSSSVKYSRIPDLLSSNETIYLFIHFSSCCSRRFAVFGRRGQITFMLSCRCGNLSLHTSEGSPSLRASWRKLFQNPETLHGVSNRCLRIGNYSEAVALRVAEGCFDVKCRCCGDCFRMAVSESDGVVQTRGEASRDGGTFPDMSRMIPLGLRPFVAPREIEEGSARPRKSDVIEQEDEMFSRDLCDQLVGPLDFASLGLPPSITTVVA